MPLRRTHLPLCPCRTSSSHCGATRRSRLSCHYGLDRLRPHCECPFPNRPSYVAPPLASQPGTRFLPSYSRGDSSLSHRCDVRPDRCTAPMGQLIPERFRDPLRKCRDAITTDTELSRSELLPGHGLTLGQLKRSGIIRVKDRGINRRQPIWRNRASGNGALIDVQIGIAGKSKEVALDQKGVKLQGAQIEAVAGRIRRMEE